ncbi:unnamed protein product, partial [marine sediment metagenome]
VSVYSAKYKDTLLVQEVSDIMRNMVNIDIILMIRNLFNLFIFIFIP